MSNQERVITALIKRPLCDDCLSASADVKPRQAVNMICRSLTEEGKLSRFRGKCPNCGGFKLLNSLQSNIDDVVEVAATTESPIATPQPSPASLNPWYWEGNIQSQVVRYLVSQEYDIVSVANTTTRDSGKDIVARAPEGAELWVTVKGYPEKSANTQARHWFSQAIFDLVLYHGENRDVRLAMAIPDGFATYQNLLPRVHWPKQEMPFKVFLVQEDGSVKHVERAGLG